MTGSRESTGRRPHSFALLAGGFFVILFASFLGQNAGLSILLARYGASALPRAYVANALALALVSFLTTRQVARFSLRPVMMGVFVVGAAVVQAVRWAYDAGHWWAPGAMYVTAFALADLLIVLFWSVANRVYDTRDAKRLFPLVSAAGTLGAAASGFFARGLVARIGTVALLDLWACLLVACAVWSHFAAARAQGIEEDVPGGEPGPGARPAGAPGSTRPGRDHNVVRTTRPGRDHNVVRTTRPGRVNDCDRTTRSAGLLWSIGTGLVFVVTVTLFGRFLYGRALEAAYPKADDLAAVNGLLIGLSNVLTLLVQLLVTSRLMSRLGVGGVGVVYPLVMLGAFAGLYAEFGMAAAVVCFFGITTARRGIQGVVETVLYTPLPPEAAGRSLVFMAMVATPAGLALSGAGLEVLKDAAPETVAVFGLVAAGACGLAAVWRAYGYRSALRARLLRGGSDVRVRFGALLDGSNATVDSILSEGLDPGDPGILERLRTLIRAHQQEEERGPVGTTSSSGRRGPVGSATLSGRRGAAGSATLSGRRGAAGSGWDESGPLGRVVDARLAEAYRLHAALGALPRVEGEAGSSSEGIAGLWRSAIRQRIGEDVAVVLAALRAGTHLADFDRISLRISDADRRVRAAAVEILDALCPEGVRPLVLPLLEEKRLAEGLKRAGRRYGEAVELHPGGAVATLLEIPDDWVRATTAYATAHLRAPDELTGTEPKLRELSSSPDRFVSFAARYALRRATA